MNWHDGLILIWRLARWRVQVLVNSNWTFFLFIVFGFDMKVKG